MRTLVQERALGLPLRQRNVGDMSEGGTKVNSSSLQDSAIRELDLSHPSLGSHLASDSAWLSDPGQVILSALKATLSDSKMQFGG